MKKNHIFTIFALLLFCVTNTSALEISTGVKGGLNLSELYGKKESVVLGLSIDPYETQVLKPGLYCGAVVQCKFAKMFAIEPELLFSQKGQKTKTSSNLLGEYTSVMRLNYLEMPVLLKILYPAGLITPSFYAGPSFGIKIGTISQQTTHNNTVLTDLQLTELDKQINPIAFGITMGFEISTKAGPGNLLFEIRSNIGLSNYEKNTNNSQADKLRVFAFGMGYLFKL
jgi:hypothetical protein